MKSYACTRHRERGGGVCPVTVHQPMGEVESALVQYLQEYVLTKGTFDMVQAEIAR